MPTKKRNTRNTDRPTRKADKQGRTRIKKEKKQKSKARKIIKWSLISLLVLILIAAGVLAGIIFGIFKKYSISIDKFRISSENTRILDTDGNVIATLNAQEKRESIKINEMSKYIPAAFVAIEDERFYDHQGIDIKRTAAATISYIFKGNSSFGGSTITQQLVKNITKDDERDATRKIKEMARAYNLEKALTKDEILELYLNMIFMGENVYGVQMASRLYFNKSAAELDLAESAFLAGINSSPNTYKPFEEDQAMKDRIKNKTLTVINKMHELGRIESEEIYNNAIEKVNNGLVFTKGHVDANVYSYHTDALIQQVINDIQKQNPDMTPQAAEYYLYNGGLTIYSTQVTSIQNVLEEQYNAENSKKYIVTAKQTYKRDDAGNYTTEKLTTESAMTIIDHKTGQVVATVGGFGQKTSRGFNRATQNPRQPGSTIKPIAVIAPSLEAGLITAGTVIDDTQISFPGWTPLNDTRNYNGLMTVRQIIKVSRNVPEVKMIITLTPEKSVEYMRSLGLKHLVDADANPATALGGLTNGVTTLEMAGAYAAIANDGEYIEPTFYTKVVDQDGNVVLEPNQEKRRVMSEDNAYILKSILRGPVTSGGTYPGAKIPNMDTCGKTGTTDIQARWFCGFTPYYTAATWYGFDYGDKVEKLYTGNNAAAIWANVMKTIHVGLENKPFKPTGNIIQAKICSKSGLLPTELCTEAGCVITEEFVKGTVPTKSCETHVKEKVCIMEDGTKKLATEFCPDAVEEIFITRPNSDTDTSWKTAGDANLMLPQETCEIHANGEEPEVTPSPEVTTTNSPLPITTETPTISPTHTPTPPPSVVTMEPTEVPVVTPVIEETDE